MDKQTLLNAVQFFPRWMNIRRRPWKSTGGKFLQSVLEEFDSVEEDLNTYKSDFFLVNYLDQLDSILSIVYAANVGTIKDLSLLSINTPDLSVTDDIELFQNDNTVLYYKDGYILARPSNVNDGAISNIIYQYDGFSYSVKFIKMHMWNIFDEFAWFAGLERLEDESNRLLYQRITNSFKNKTNCTREGLLNSIANLLNISSTILTNEEPTEDILKLEDETYGTIYERISQLNKDSARTKQWDASYWENSFADIDYIPHIWDSPVTLYQNGVGYNDSIKTIVSNNDNLTTNLYVTGYKKSQQVIKEYIQNNNIEKEISLTLKKYKNILNSQKVDYKITASTALKIDPSDISIGSYIIEAGIQNYPIDSLYNSSNDVSITSNASLVKDKKYKLIFKPKSSVGYMNISKCLLGSTDLREDKDQYKIVNNILTNTDVKYYTDSTDKLKSYSNISNVDSGGIQLDNISANGTFSLDVSNYSGQYIHIGHHSTATNIIDNSVYVKPNGFVLENNSLKDLSSSFDHTITINLRCTYLTFNMQLGGSIVYSVKVNGTTYGDIQYSMLNTGTFNLQLDSLSNVEVVIRKNGQDPVIIDNIKAAIYDLKLSTDVGNLITTSMGMIIPSNAVTLYGTLITYNTYSPIIDYIHIGALLNNAVYTIDNINVTSDNIKLDIDTNCDVTLINVTNNTMVNNYTTYNTYTATDKDGTIYINPPYDTIISSTPEIKTVVSGGTTKYYIIVPKNTSVSTISINGSKNTLLLSKTLSTILSDNGYADYDCYVNDQIQGLILRKGNTEKIFYIKRSLFSDSVNMFRISINDSKIGNIFILDSALQQYSYSSIIYSDFEQVYFVPKEVQTYIAYNTKNMLQKEVYNIPIVYNFSPLLRQDALVLYSISDVITSDLKATVQFQKTVDNNTVYENWCLSNNTQGIYINIDIDPNNIELYQEEIHNISRSFVLSNSIQLDSSYVDSTGNTLELAQYIITPPEYMAVDYTNMNTSEVFYAQNDGFNKLKYSNIVNIISINCEDSDYSILKDSGIIVWNNTNIYGKEIEVSYSYKYPTHIYFIDYSYLYDLINYTVDAYEKINSDPLIYNNLSINDSIVTTFDNPDYIVARCSNDLCIAKTDIDSQRITIYSISDNNNILVHNGYYYNDNKEYWYFSNKHKEDINKNSGIDINNYYKQNGNFILSSSSSNYIDNSAFDTADLAELCNINFLTNKHIPAISVLNSLSACDTLNKWYLSAMNTSIINTTNDLGISFTSEKEYSYAALDITDYIHSGSIISCLTKDSIKLSIAKDITIDNMHLKKNVFAEPLYDFILEDSIYQNTTIDEYDSNSRYYLIVTGTGVLDEIIITDTKDTNKNIHTKNIDKFNINVTENRESDTYTDLLFSPDFSYLSGLEFDRDNTLLIGTNIDYNLTLIKDIDLSWCTINNFKEENNSLVSLNEEASVLTPIINIPNSSFLGKLIVKINNVLLSDMQKGFTIEVLTGTNAAQTLDTVYVKKDVNYIEIDSSYMKDVTQIRVVADNNKIIESIQIYGLYTSNTNAPHIYYNDNGYMITKVFDSSVSNTYRIHKILADNITNIDSIKFSISGAKEDNGVYVWTKYKQLTLNEDLTIKNNNDILFDGYRMFKLRIDILNSESKIRLKGIQLYVQ